MLFRKTLLLPLGFFWCTIKPKSFYVQACYPSLERTVSPETTVFFPWRVWLTTKTGWDLFNFLSNLTWKTDLQFFVHNSSYSDFVWRFSSCPLPKIYSFINVFFLLVMGSYFSFIGYRKKHLQAEFAFTCIPRELIASDHFVASLLLDHVSFLAEAQMIFQFISNWPHI